MVSKLTEVFRNLPNSEVTIRSTSSHMHIRSWTEFNTINISFVTIGRNKVALEAILSQVN